MKERKESSVRFANPSEADSGDYLLAIVYHQGQYFLTRSAKQVKPTYISMIETHPWWVCRYMPRERCHLRENDVIRFGRISFKVTRIRFKTKVGEYLKHKDESGPGHLWQETVKKQNQSLQLSLSETHALE